MTHKQKIFLLLAVVGTLILVAVFFLKPALVTKDEALKPRILEEHITIPDTKKISAIEAQTVFKGEYDVYLAPKNENERVVVPNAILTPKGSFDAANPHAKTWAEDAKLVFIKSLGAVTLEGKSSTWQMAFGSKKKKAGYVAIVQGDAFLSGKEVESDFFGFELPLNWYDSSEAVMALQSMPQFQDATISSLLFYYSMDGKRWEYAFSSSRGNTSMMVK